MRCRLLALSLFLVMGLSGCALDFSTRATGADTIEDLQAEDRYKSVYAQHMTAFHWAVQVLAPTEDPPGVCNAGENKQACYEADVQMIIALERMLTALKGLEVPPRYKNADVVLGEAIALDIRALELRNEAIANNDDAAFQEHKVVLADAVEMFDRAYAMFPEDNRPSPSP